MIGSRIPIDIGVFAYNEAARIASMAGQDIFDKAEIDARLVILSNGCTDDTAGVARAALAAVPGRNHAVVDMAEGGKSRTWNRYVHHLSRPDARILMFCDADVHLPDPAHLRRMVETLAGRPALWALNSRPAKDIGYSRAARGLVERLIAAGGDTLDDWRTAICGQLYAMPAGRARVFHLPVGLPVEDGFLRAMVLTDALTGPERFERLDGQDSGFHIYPSERTIGGLLRHQTRIVVGGAVNAALFAHFRALRPDKDRQEALRKAAADPDFVSRVLASRLPALPSGCVPGGFLWKRLTGFRHAQAPLPRRLATLTLGLVFDTLVWRLAQLSMAGGKGAE